MASHHGASTTEAPRPGERVKLVVIVPEDYAGLDLLKGEAKGIDLVVSEDAATVEREIADAEAVALAHKNVPLLRRFWSGARKLRWVHALGAGIEPLMFEELIASDVTLTNSRGIFGDALAEFTIAAMLWFAKDLPRLVRQKQARDWTKYSPERLEGATLGIIGLGGIGREVARRAAAMKMRVIATRRRLGAESDAAVERLYSPDDIDLLIAQSDYVAVCTPLTDATRGLLSASRLQRMKPNGVLINVSRGAVVDEPALIEMLRTRRIRGAALDVFHQEPLPPDHPLWALDNVLLSPHTADHAPDSHLRAMKFFLENLRRYRADEPLENIVDKRQQY